jgi:hypothetical protein
MPPSSHFALSVATVLDSEHPALAALSHLLLSGFTVHALPDDRIWNVNVPGRKA